MKNVVKTGIVFILFLCLSSCNRQPTASMILMNGKIITMDEDFSIAEAVAIKAGKIIDAGTNEKVGRYAGEQTEIIDLKGKTVIPGIIDAHCHTINASLSELEAEIPDLHSIEELLDWIQSEAASKREGEWIVSPKIFFTRLSDLRQPTLEELDRVAPANPVFLNGSYGGMINSSAMKASGISRATENEGLVRDEETGELTGFIRASAFKLLKKPSSANLSSPEKEEALRGLLKEYNKCGITGIISGLGGRDNLELYQSLRKRGELSVRVSQNFRVPSHARGSKESLLDSLKTLATSTGKGDEWVRTGSLKIFLDGGILTGTAYLREPWGDTAQRVFGFNDPLYRGIINYSHEDLVAIISAAYESGWSFTAHCTGGGGVDCLLDAFEEVDKMHSIKDRRFSIIHGNFYTAEAIERMNRLGILANAQAAWFYKDADAMKYILGDERVKAFNPFRSLAEGGVVVCGGSDHMVKMDPNTSINPYNPFLGMWTMITRITERGNVVMASEAISRPDALKMYTINNAYASFEENIKGSIEPGKLADMVVLSDDILTCPEDRIRHIHSELTMVGGKVVYSKEHPDEYDADVIIYGGTSAAITAAVETVQSGITVIVVSPDKHLGGLTSEGVGFTDYGKKEAIGGLSREFYHRIWKHYNEEESWTWQKKSEYGNIGQGTPAIDGEHRTMWIFEPHAAEQVFEDFVREYQITVHRGEFLNRETGVARSRGSILSITTLSGKTYSGRIFMDATYEGDLMAAAGISYHVGRESMSTYNEKWNGVQTGVLHHKHWFEKKISPYIIPGDPSSGVLPRISTEDPGEYGSGDHKIQAYCYRVCMTKEEENKVPFPRPENYDASQYELLLRIFNAGWDEWFEKFDPIPNKKTDTNNHGPFSMDNIGMNYDYPEAGYERRKEILDEHRNYQMGLLWFVANDPRIPEDFRTEMAEWGLAKDEFADNNNWPRQLYVREARRMIGKYLTTEQDVLVQREVPEPVGMGSYTVDSHNVQRYITPGGYVQNEGDIGVRPPSPYSISYGSLVPEKSECENLLVPVCVSSSHIAFGSVRMEPVFMILGQSAAVAATLAIDNECAVQDIEYAILKSTLQEKGQVLTLGDLIE